VGRYNLYGVLVHAGRSTHSGHYYCYVRSPAGVWYELDDSSVRSVSERTVLSQKAYMLFYLRVPSGGGGGGSDGPASPLSRAAATASPAPSPAPTAPTTPDVRPFSKPLGKKAKLAAAELAAAEAAVALEVCSGVSPAVPSSSLPGCAPELDFLSRGAAGATRVWNQTHPRRTDHETPSIGRQAAAKAKAKAEVEAAASASAPKAHKRRGQTDADVMRETAPCEAPPRKKAKLAATILRCGGALPSDAT
jgi:hypothetical protein